MDLTARRPAPCDCTPLCIPPIPPADLARLAVRARALAESIAQMEQIGARLVSQRRYAAREAGALAEEPRALGERIA